MSDDIREEQYLADIRTAAQGGEGYYDLDPIIRKEFYYTDIINALKNGGGGGGGFTPTDAQLAAMNSGITAEKLQTDESNISSLQTTTQGIDSTGDDFIEINGKKLYFSTTAPSNPSDGDWWLD